MHVIKVSNNNEIERVHREVNKWNKNKQRNPAGQRGKKDWKKLLKR